MDLTMMGMDSMSVGFNNFQLHGIIPSALRYNEEFRDMFLTRLGECCAARSQTRTRRKRSMSCARSSNRRSARDLARWGKSSTLFATQMANLRGFVSGRARGCRTS